MNNRYVIVYYGREPKPPKVFYATDIEALFAEIVDLTKKKALFAVYELGKCVGDFS